MPPESRSTPDPVELPSAATAAPPAARPPWWRRAGQAVAESRVVAGGVSWYRRHEHVALLLFFFGGVAWDALTLTRIDLWVDNLYLIVYLGLLGTLLMAAALVEREATERPWLVRWQEWYPAAIQFLMGALFSAYVIYYAQSATLARTALFLLVLVGLLVLNEFVHRRLANLYLLFGFYYVACFAFLAFFIPVVIGRIGFDVFVAAGVASALVVAAMLTALYRHGVFPGAASYVGALGLVTLLFGLTTTLYLYNLIPPVPLAMREGGVYHDVRWQGDDFLLTYERPRRSQFWRTVSPTFHRAGRAPVYCFAAVFAPTDLEEELYHAWQYLDPETEEWTMVDRIGYRIHGGRDGGFRGFTFKRNVRPGLWRVDVETAEGLLVGRIRFRIADVEALPARNLAERLYD